MYCNGNCNEIKTSLDNMAEAINALTAALSQHIPPRAQCKRYLTLTELAAELGLPRSTLYKRILPYHLIGGEGRKFYVKDECLDYTQYPLKLRRLIERKT